MKPSSASISQAPRLLDQMRERARYLHYSHVTEKAYVYWVRFFIRWSGMRHPRDMGVAEVEAYLALLAAAPVKVSVVIVSAQDAPPRECGQLMARQGLIHCMDFCHG